MQFGEVDIRAIVLDPNSRDDIRQLLRGLQYIYTTPELRARVFAILEEVVPVGVNGQADTSEVHSVAAVYRCLLEFARAGEVFNVCSSTA